MNKYQFLNSTFGELYEQLQDSFEYSNKRTKLCWRVFHKNNKPNIIAAVITGEDLQMWDKFFSKKIEKLEWAEVPDEFRNSLERIYNGKTKKIERKKFLGLF